LLAVEKGGGQVPGFMDKVVKTICAIANIGPKSTGKIIIGVTDKKEDAERIKEIDAVEPRKVGKRFVVGVNREAKRLNCTTEQYFAKWRDAIKNSKLSEGLRGEVLSNMDFNSFYGLGVIVITIRPQSEVSYLGDDVYWRNGSSTELAATSKQVAAIARRF
jgi:predicted HTH transcriptional regulator